MLRVFSVAHLSSAALLRNTAFDLHGGGLSHVGNGDKFYPRTRVTQTLCCSSGRNCKLASCE